MIFKYFKITVAVFLLGVVGYVFATENAVLFYSNWSSGIDKRLQFQSLTEESIKVAVMEKPGLRKAVRIQINRDADYRNVANGAPRAELSFGGFLHFVQNAEYIVRWKTYIPEDYVFDSKQPELIAQIHQGPAAGYPPFALFISEMGTYEVHNRTARPVDAVTGFFGSPLSDIGRVVQWQLRYRPDWTGENSLTELTKDGKIVFSLKNTKNSYENDNRAYFKFGIYKSDWLKKESDVSFRMMYFGDVLIEEAVH
jgi:hypothetical protein